MPLDSRRPPDMTLNTACLVRHNRESKQSSKQRSVSYVLVQNTTPTRRHTMFATHFRSVSINSSTERTNEHDNITSTWMKYQVWFVDIASPLLLLSCFGQKGMEKLNFHRWTSSQYAHTPVETSQWAVSLVFPREL